MRTADSFVTTPATTTSIAEPAFSECAELKALQRAAPVTCAPMGAQAFLGSGPTARPLLASVAATGSGALGWCRGLAQATFVADSQPAATPQGAFGCCDRLGAVSLPASAASTFLGVFLHAPASWPSAPAAGCRLQCVEGSAFNGCAASAAFDLPASLPAMRDYVFCGCTARTQETFGWAATDINVDALQRSGVGASGPAISPQMAFVGPPPSRQADPCDSVCGLVSQAARGWSQVRARV